MPTWTIQNEGSRLLPDKYQTVRLEESPKGSRTQIVPHHLIERVTFPVNLPSPETVEIAIDFGHQQLRQLIIDGDIEFHPLTNTGFLNNRGHDKRSAKKELFQQPSVPHGSCNTILVPCGNLVKKN